MLDQFEGLIQPLDQAAYTPAHTDDLTRIAHHDERDWPILAAALVLDCPIWTEDQDYFGTGVATWTTDRVEIYLRSSNTLI